LPGGWIWDDIGNYYGAGTWAINWNENQYDLQLKPGAREGDNVEVTSTNPNMYDVTIDNNLKSGKPEVAIMDTFI
jgi:D-alanyl-D-alanine carboxypeptidase/D-alanyl-D-alanine-endopeptidase (penicillin-binding protein 4)